MKRITFLCLALFLLLSSCKPWDGVENPLAWQQGDFLLRGVARIGSESYPVTVQRQAQGDAAPSLLTITLTPSVGEPLVFLRRQEGICLAGEEGLIPLPPTALGIPALFPLFELDRGDLVSLKEEPNTQKRLFLATLTTDGGTVVLTLDQEGFPTQIEATLHQTAILLTVFPREG